MDLAIESRNAVVLPEWLALVEGQLQGVTQGHDDIIHARLTVTKNRHHRRGCDEVTMVLTVPGDVLAVTRTADDVENALFQACQAMDRQVRIYREQRYRTPKSSGPRAAGTIVSWFPDRGYGFLRTEGDREVFFHAHTVDRADRPNIVLGAQVEFEVEQGEKGPQAARLSIRR
jgi:cold shock CspA family protein/ribosome-associated translation inhibitor RaiA